MCWKCVRKKMRCFCKFYKLVIFVYWLLFSFYRYTLSDYVSRWVNSSILTTLKMHLLYKQIGKWFSQNRMTYKLLGFTSSWSVSSECVNKLRTESKPKPLMQIYNTSQRKFVSCKLNQFCKKSTEWDYLSHIFLIVKL